jgi:amidase
VDHKPQRSEEGLIAMTAIEVIGLLRDGEVSSLDLLDALEHRIAAVDGAVGALPTLCITRRQEAGR